MWARTYKQTQSETWTIKCGHVPINRHNQRHGQLNVGTYL